MLDLLKFLDQVPLDRTVPTASDKRLIDGTLRGRDEEDSASSMPCCSERTGREADDTTGDTWQQGAAEDDALKELEDRALLSRRSLLGVSSSEDEWFLNFLREEETLQCA